MLEIENDAKFIILKKSLQTAKAKLIGYHMSKLSVLLRIRREQVNLNRERLKPCSICYK